MQDWQIETKRSIQELKETRAECGEGILRNSSKSTDTERLAGDCWRLLDEYASITLRESEYQLKRERTLANEIACMEIPVE